MKNPSAVALGSMTSPAKAAAARVNGKRGGRPKKATTPDVRVENHGSIIILQPLTPAAKDWLQKHIPADAQWFAGGVAVEPRYVGDIVDGMQADGLEVR